MFKNEADILEDWLRYHLAIFGDGNIHLINDHSTDDSAAILDRFRGRITVESSIVSGPVYKAENMSRLMAEYKQQCDFLIPLDADEFICLQNSADPKKIRAMLQSFNPMQAGRFKFSLNYLAIPTTTEASDPLISYNDFTVDSLEFGNQERLELNKCFFSAQSFIGSDGGNHRGYTHDERTEYTDLWLITFPVRSRSQLENKLCKGALYNGFWKRFPNNSSHWRSGYTMLREGKLEEYYLRLTKRRPQARRHFFAEQLSRLRDGEHLNPELDPATESFMELARCSSRVASLLSAWVCTPPASHPHFDLPEVSKQSWRALADDAASIIRYGMLRCYNPSTFVQFGSSALLPGVDEAIDFSDLRTEALLLPLDAADSIAKRLEAGDLISVENLSELNAVLPYLPSSVVVEVRLPERGQPVPAEPILTPSEMADAKSWQLLLSAASLSLDPLIPPNSLWLRVPG